MSGELLVELMFQPLKKFAEFNGRARRTEYWLFVLFECLLLLGLLILFAAIAAVFPTDASGQLSDQGASIAGGLVLVGVLIYLVLFLPRLAVLVRRLHGTDNSGWLVLLAIVPLGGIVLFIFTLLDGTAGTNQHGPDPKGRGQPRVADAFT